ncbi:prolactin-releasing peptide receptor-like [Branchiostoma lanceolatum]|uniref:prolactin-releasing peptide receptor-like n=1 Tax=Branchiostoma lanceolatum TaxID=7740 RepID=UPI003455B9BF
MDVRLEELLQNSSLLDKLNFTDLLYHQYFDLAEYVLSTRSQIAIVVVYSVAILLSLIGNILVVMVMAKNLSKGTKLRTFLINLAVADLVMAVFCMPFTFTDVMLQQWLFGSVMCPLVRFFQVLSVSVSIFTLVAIGVDRYQAVMYPLRMRMSKSRAKQVVAIIWIMSFALAAVQLAVCRVYQVQSGGTWYQRCEEILWPGHNYRIGYTIVLTCVTYVLPLSILAVTYYKIGVKLWGRHSPSSIYSLEDISERKHERCKRKVKMIIILVGLFAVCWLPIHIFSIVLDFCPDVILSSRQTVMVFFFCSHWLAMSHSFVNPIIYGFLNDSFRTDLKWLCLRHLSRARWLRTSSTKTSSNSGFGRNVTIHWSGNNVTITRGTRIRFTNKRQTTTTSDEQSMEEGDKGAGVSCVLKIPQTDCEGEEPPGGTSGHGAQPMLSHEVSVHQDGGACGTSV